MGFLGSQVEKLTQYGQYSAGRNATEGGVPVQIGKRGWTRGAFLVVMLELNLKTGRGVSPKGKHSGGGHQMCKGMKAWPHEPYLWSFRKSLGLESQWEEAAARDKGLACRELSIFWPQGPEYLPGLVE